MATHEVNKLNEARIRTDLKPEGADEIAKHLRDLLADVFAPYLKAKNFHWHMHGRLNPPLRQELRQRTSRARRKTF